MPTLIRGMTYRICSLEIDTLWTFTTDSPPDILFHGAAAGSSRAALLAGVLPEPCAWFLGTTHHHRALRAGATCVILKLCTSACMAGPGPATPRRMDATCPYPSRERAWEEMARSLALRAAMASRCRTRPRSWATHCCCAATARRVSAAGAAALPESPATAKQTSRLCRS